MPSFEVGEVRVWFGTDDAPAPSGTAPYGSPLPVRIGVEPTDADIIVRLRFRRPGGAWMSLPARPVPSEPNDLAQYYEATFDDLAPGTVIEYSVEIARTGEIANPITTRSTKFQVETVAQFHGAPVNLHRIEATTSSATVPSFDDFRGRPPLADTPAGRASPPVFPREPAFGADDRPPNDFDPISFRPDQPIWPEPGTAFDPTTIILHPFPDLEGLATERNPDFLTRPTEGYIEGIPYGTTDLCDHCGQRLSVLSKMCYLSELILLIQESVRDHYDGWLPKFPDVPALEQRFFRSFAALEAESPDEALLLQIEIAVDVLERFCYEQGFGTRAALYEKIRTGGDGVPNPSIFRAEIEAYLNEIGLDADQLRSALTAAYSGPAPRNREELDALYNTTGLTETEILAVLDLDFWDVKDTSVLLYYLSDEPNPLPSAHLLQSIHDNFPALVRMVYYTKTSANRGDTGPVPRKWSDAEAAKAIDRVKEFTLPALRANLVHLAIAALRRSPILIRRGSRVIGQIDIPDAKTLGNYLHTDLSANASLRSSRIQDAIEALQSYIRALLLGREDDSNLLVSDDGHTIDDQFQSRWQWLQSYELWHAAQMVFLRPENFMPSATPAAQTEAFLQVLTSLNDMDDPVSSIAAAVDEYSEAVGAHDQSIRNMLAPYPMIDGKWHGYGYLAGFRSAQQSAYATAKQDEYARRILDEWYLHIPLAIARTLRRTRRYFEAIQWLHGIYYPYTAGLVRATDTGGPMRVSPFIHARLEQANKDSSLTTDISEWLRDPLNPHNSSRVGWGAPTRNVVYQYVATLLEWAEAEFVHETDESISHARELYELADELLDRHAERRSPCGSKWQQVWEVLYSSHSLEEINAIRLALDVDELSDAPFNASDLDTILLAIRAPGSLDERLINIRGVVEGVVARAGARPTLGALLERLTTCRHTQLFERAWAAYEATWTWQNHDVSHPPDIRSGSEAMVVARSQLRLACGWCLPTNPLVDALRSRIDSALEKIASGRNHAGFPRIQVPKSARHTSRSTPEYSVALPLLAAREDVVAPSTIYRSSYLIERARAYTNTALQFETLLLNTYERQDEAEYSHLKAQQGLAMARARVALYEARAQEATSAIELAKLRRARAAVQNDHYTRLVAVDRDFWEREALRLLELASDAQFELLTETERFYLGRRTAPHTRVFQVQPQYISHYSLLAQQASMRGAFEMRRKEWVIQRQLSEVDVAIGEQEILQATQQFNLAVRELDVANLDFAFSVETVTFLSTKFTSRELWDWMAGELRRYYRSHLDLGTALARAAQNALEFERQQAFSIVAPYYAETEKRDLLAAERLLTDINTLDHERLVTDRRLKEIPKIISLASVMPTEFLHLQTTGWTRFSTLMEWFDRDFPGHYMRRVTGVDVTIIGLVPPGESVHATLSNNGISRIVVGPPSWLPHIIRRPAESIAFTAISPGGLFELKPDDVMLLPFEGSGVETTWTLEMPKGANRFDYDTLVDVQLNIRYTALDDSNYRAQVVQRLERRIVSALPFSARVSYPDEWYHFNNPRFASDPSSYGFGPGKLTPPYVFEFYTSEVDFPPNEEQISLQRIALMFSQSRAVEVPFRLEFVPGGATESYLVDATYSWVRSPTGLITNEGGPASISSFTHVRKADGILPLAGGQELSTITSPFGAWRLSIETSGKRLDGSSFNVATNDYLSGEEVLPGQRQLDLSWLRDLVWVFTYEAHVDFAYAE